MPYLRVATYLLISLLLLALGPAAFAQGGDAPVAAPADATSVDSSHSDFATYPLIVDRIAQRGGINGNISATRTVEGALAQRSYRVGGDATAADVVAGYGKRLAEAGFESLYECGGADCGPTFVRASPGYRAKAGRFDAPLAQQYYLAAMRRDAGGDVYVSVQAAPDGDTVAVQLDTVRVKPRQVGAISVNAAEMARDLANQGRVALYGIFFNTDSAEIKPESKPTLDEIATLLQNNPDLRLLVVGHTDSRGSFDYNIDLSTRRAQAVVAALVQQHDIDADRLKPWGVGFAAPRASNDSDVGQAKNRRVELVVW